MDLIAKFRKGLASVVSTAVVAMTIVAAPSAQAAWYDVYVNALTEAGVVDASFDASADTTRLGFTTALVKAAGLSASDNDAGFADVNDGYVNAAVENGIVDGPKAEKGNNFFPNDQITRAAVTKVVLEALGVDVEAYASPAAPHADVDSNEWFASYVSAAYNLSIVDGVNNSTEAFNPAGNIKDAAMSKIVSYGVIASADPENHVRFDDGVSAFSVYEESDIETNVVALVDAEEMTEEEEEEENEEENEETVVVSDGSLEVSLSPETPSAQNIPYNVQGVAYLALDLTANGDDVNVESLTVGRSGLGDNDDFDQVWVEIEGERVSSQKSINSDDVAVITLQNVSVEAGETVTAVVMASMDACETGGSPAACTGSNAASGHTNTLRVVSADAVETNAESVVGDFPITSAAMGIADYNVAEVRFGESGSNTTVEVGDVAEELARFTLNANGDKDLLVKSIRFKNTGTAEISESLANLFLETSGQNVAEGSVSGDYVTFTFDDYVIEDGDTDTFRIKADIVYQEASDTVIFKIDDKEDLVAIETDTMYAASAIGEDNTNDAEDANATLTTATLSAGNTTISKDPSSPTNTSVSSDTDGVEVLLAKIVADQEITAEGITLTETGSVDTGELENIRVYVNGTLVDSQDPSGTEGSTSATIDFDSTFTLKQGVNEIRVVTDVKDTADNEDTIIFGFTNTALDSPEYVANGDTATITGAATSSVFTVADTVISVTRNDGFSGETVIAGATGVELMKFVVDATDGEVRINSIDVANGGSASDSDITGVKLMVAGEQVGSTDDMDASFTGLDYTIAENSQATFSVLADISSSASGNISLTVTVDAEDKNADQLTGGSNDTTETSATFSVASSGSLTVTTNGDTPNTELLVANSTDVEVAQFKFTAEDDNIEITDLVLSTGNSNTDARVAAFKLYSDGELIASKTTTSGTASFDLPSNGFVVEKDTNAVLTVKADFNSITEANETGESFTVSIDDIQSNSVATGNSLVDGVYDQFDVLADGTVDINESGAVDGSDDATDLLIGTEQFDVINGQLDIDEDGDIDTDDDASDLTVGSEQFDVIDGEIDIDEDGDTTSEATSDLVASQTFTAEAMYVVKTRPTLTTQTLSTSKLVSGEQTLYKVSVAADSAEDVEVATISFDISGKTSAETLVDTDGTTDIDNTSNDGTVNGFKLFVNGSEVDSGDYALTIVDTSDVFTVKFSLTSGNEETVSAGSSKVFEVKATVAGVESDDYISTKVTEDTGFSGGVDYSTASGNLVWSDNAGSPHSRTTTDWFDGTEVPGLDTATTTLQN